VAGQPEILCYAIGGVQMFMTHGHKHWVKSGTDLLLSAARNKNAQVALYGHTHVPDCRREEDGLWVLNPGSCNYYGGTVGLIVVENEKVVSCRILTQRAVEGFA
jgi:predicted phosphodiesterase